MTMRCQQYELYAAERRVPLGRQFGGPEEIQAWVDRLRDTWWWQMWYPQVLRVEAYSRPGARDSVGSWHPEMNAGKIEMSRAHWNELVVLHELAHVLAAARYGSRSHDPWFARVYLELVALVMGSASYQALYHAFGDAGIAHEIPSENRLGAARPMPAAA